MGNLDAHLRVFCCWVKLQSYTAAQANTLYHTENSSEFMLLHFLLIPVLFFYVLLHTQDAVVSLLLAPSKDYTATDDDTVETLINEMFFFVRISPHTSLASLQAANEEISRMWNKMYFHCVYSLSLSFFYEETTTTSFKSQHNEKFLFLGIKRDELWFCTAASLVKDIWKERRRKKNA